jgi:hypothetical protein
MNHPILTSDTTTTTNTKFPKVEKTKPNFLVIKLSYNFNIVLPYKEGLGLLQAMESAEVFKIRNYNKNDARVLPMSYAGIPVINWKPPFCLMTSTCKPS